MQFYSCLWPMACGINNWHYIASSKTHGNTMWLPNDRTHLVVEWFPSDFNDPSVYLVVSQCKAHKDSLKQRISCGTDDNLENSRTTERLEIWKRYPISMTIKRGQIFWTCCAKCFNFSGGIILSMTPSLESFLWKVPQDLLSPQNPILVLVYERDQRDDFSILLQYL